MSWTQRFSEGHAVLTGLHAQNRAIGVHNTAWVSMSTYHRAVCLINVGVLAAAGTLNVLLQEATDNAGAGVQNIAGKTITQLTQAGGDGDDWVIIELRSEEMDENNAYDFIRAQATVAGNTVFLSVWLLGIISRFPPVPIGTVTEIID